MAVKSDRQAQLSRGVTMTKESKPRPLAGGAGAEKSSKVERSKFRSQSPSKQAEYWLHVDADGLEHRLDRELKHLSLHVIVADGVETVTTRCYPTFFGPWPGFAGKKPRGSGWVLVDTSHDRYNVWQRKAARS